MMRCTSLQHTHIQYMPYQRRAHEARRRRWSYGKAIYLYENTQHTLTVYGVSSTVSMWILHAHSHTHRQKEEKRAKNKNAFTMHVIQSFVCSFFSLACSLNRCFASFSSVVCSVAVWGFYSPFHHFIRSFGCVRVCVFACWIFVLSLEHTLLVAVISFYLITWISECKREWEESRNFFCILLYLSVWCLQQQESQDCHYENSWSDVLIKWKRALQNSC